MKLVQREVESDALRGFLRERQDERRVTSALSRVEVVRAVLAGGQPAIAHARRQLARLDQINLDRDLLDEAAVLVSTEMLRSLDAVHLACARRVGSDLRALITYDHRMGDAAQAMGLVVEAPR